MVTQALQHPRGSSYSESGDENLATLQDYLSNSRPTPSPNPNDESLPTTEDMSEVSSSDFEQLATFHMAGWAMRKVFKLSELKTCEQCLDNIFCTAEETTVAVPPLPYLFTLTLSNGYLKYVGYETYMVAQKLVECFKAAFKSSESTVNPELAGQFRLQFEKTQVAVNFATTKDHHGPKIVAKFTEYLTESLIKRHCKIRNKESSAKNVTNYAGKSSQMRTSVETVRVAEKRGAPESSNETAKRKKTSAGIPSDVGLSLGGSSALNSLLQILYSNDRAVQRVLDQEIEYENNQDGSKLTEELSNMFKKMRDSSLQVEQAKSLEQHLTQLFGSLEMSGEELCKLIFQRLAEEPKGKPLTDLIQGEITSKLSCYVCDIFELVVERFTVLNCAPNNTDHLQKMVNQLNVTETRDEKECKTCQITGGMCSTSYISKSPQLLVVYVDRQDHNLSINTTPLKIEDVLNITLHSGRKIKYQLFGAFIYQGHDRYLALAKRRNRWCLYENELCKKISKAEFDKCFSAYVSILFYAVL
ncbi:uncharacterized protein LOC135935331 [Cloeon dipterum]|uniref:uncharacterized protein LOC135935331 n=1 Tax=Cloeon dipterum TaxID=197152 RepID=UPI00321F7769